MRRNISANIVSIGSMRIAEEREEEEKEVMLVEEEDSIEVEWLLSGPFHLSEIARGESSPSVIHRDLITARTETRARLDVAFSPRDYRYDTIILFYFDNRETSAKSDINTIIEKFFFTPNKLLVLYFV